MAPIEEAPVQRRRLRAELRRARGVAGLTQRDVADAMDWSLSKLIRIESGSVGISTTDLRVLLQHYGIVEPTEVDRFVQMARASKVQHAWWTEYREATSPKYLEFLAFENSASVIQQFEPMIVPGLLQNEDYARAVLQELAGSVSEQRIDSWVELRMRRQETLFSLQRPLEMEFVLTEAVLRCRVGGPEVMARQLRRLRDEAAKDNVTIDIVPFSAGAHPGMKGPLVILQFDGPEEDVLFLENSRGDMISRDEQMELQDYRQAFARLRDLAEKGSLIKLIDEIQRDLERAEP
jgi:transcriptional regulator with XRE-family HTH domain